MSKGFDYELTLTPVCARAGQSFTATMKLPPNTSGGAFMPFYADGSWEQGKSDLAREDGLVSYTWVARAVPGEGRLVTSATDSQAGKRGTKIVAFRVVEATKSC